MLRSGESDGGCGRGGGTPPLDADEDAAWRARAALGRGSPTLFLPAQASSAMLSRSFGFFVCLRILRAISVDSVSQATLWEKTSRPPFLCIQIFYAIGEEGDRRLF